MALTASREPTGKWPVRNLIPNPSMEVNATGWTAWNGTPVRDTGEHLRGVGSLKITTTGGQVAEGAYPGFADVTAHSTRAYSGQVAVKVPVTGNYYLQLYGADGGGGANGPTVACTAGQWTWLKCEGWTPGITSTRAAFLIVKSSNYAASALLYMDCFMLVEGSTIGEYVDGDQPGCVWEGTAHASASRQLGPVNRVPNPSFEVDGASGATVNGSATISRSTDRSYKGGASLKVVSPGTLFYDGATWNSAVLVTGGVTYTVRLWVYMEVGAPAGTKFELGFNGRDSASGYFGSGGQTVVDATPGVWQQITYTQTAVPKTGFIDPYLVAYQLPAVPVACTFYIDGWQAVAEASAGSYFDGSLADFVSDVPNWSGTAHASPSYLLPASSSPFLKLSAPSPSTQSVTLIGADTAGFLLATGSDALLPLPVFDEAYADSPDAEGALRVRSSAQNVTSTINVLVYADDAATFQARLRTLQQTVEACRRNGSGTLAYTPDGGVPVTYQILSAQISQAPYDGQEFAAHLAQWTITLTMLPFGLMTPITVPAVTGDIPMFGIEVGDRSYSSVVQAEPSLALYWRLGTNGLTDQSPYARNGTAAGGLSVGGVAAPGLLTDATGNETDGATAFAAAGYATSSYAPFAPGCLVTVSGIANRTDGSSLHSLFGTNNGVHGLVSRCVSGSSDIDFYSDVSGSQNIWTNAQPSYGTTFHWALILDDVAHTAELFINGRSKGIKTGINSVQASNVGTFEAAGWASGNNPFKGTLDEIAVFSGRLSPERIWAQYQASKIRVAVPGSADALLQLTLTDQATQNRDHVEVGVQERYDSTAVQRTLLHANELTAGSATLGASPSTGNWDPTGTGQTLNAIASTVPVTLCSTTVSWAGRMKIKARVMGKLPNFAPCYFRASVQLGDGAFVPGTWVAGQSVAQSWFEVDLGIANIPTALAGAQSAVVQIECYGSVGTSTVGSVAVNFVELVPVSKYTKVRGTSTSAIGQAITPVATDSFNQTAGALTGKTPDLGAAWVGAGSGTDFQLDTTNARVTRVQGSDTLWSGRYDGLGSSAVGQGVQANVQVGTVSAIANSRVGILLRWDGTAANWFMVRLDGTGQMTVWKSVGSVRTQLGGPVSAGYAIGATIDAAGNWIAYSPGKVTLTGQDSALAGGGASPASGKPGIYGENTSGVLTDTAIVDDVVSWSLPAQHALNSGQSLRIDHQSALRLDSGVAGNPYSVEGTYLKVHPGEVSRICVKARRVDADTLQDTGLTDATQVDMVITPRAYLLG